MEAREREEGACLGKVNLAPGAGERGTLAPGARTAGALPTTCSNQ